VLTLAEIQARAFTTATAKGWHERPLIVDHHVDHDRVLAKLALVHSELTEAHNAIEAGEFGLHFVDDKPEGLLAEIADGVIRIGDLTGALGLVLDAEHVGHWLTRASDMRPACEIRRSSADMRDVHAVLWLAKTRTYVDAATEAVRIGDWAEAEKALTLAVLYAASIVAGYGHDLGAAIEAKMDYNDTRSHRHGGKQA
jgi:hypothetical protein